MNFNPARFFRRLLVAAAVILLLTAFAAGWFYWRIHQSLPQNDGTAHLAGLSSPVTVIRDALGVPTIRGETRTDVSRALGWLHAQERFFQMDLLRRSAAGELAELFGPRALPRDRSARRHGFRDLAQQVLARLPADERAQVEAYTTGVNQGLAALAARPWEYLLLREPPVPWRPADTVLVVYALTLDLQDAEGRHEHSLMVLRDELGRDALAFFAPTATPTDAALDGATGPLAPIPPATVINLRTKKTAATATPLSRWAMTTAPNVDDQGAAEAAAAFPFSPREPAFANGSNAFALAGTHTRSGAGMLANDMHLHLGVPNIWYRASLAYAGRTITGVTLPGAPAIVAGSNGHVAWGFTAAYFDTGDLVVVEVNSIANSLYKVPGSDELVAIKRRDETIKVKGAEPVVINYESTVWGPIVGANERKRPLAHRWVAHDPSATNLTLLEMEGATTVAAALALAPRLGLPALNCVLADRHGAIGWTLVGRIPKRIGYDGRLPVTWSYGDRKWDGYLAPSEVPTLTFPRAGGTTELPAANPAWEGRIWSANQRPLGADAWAKIGNGGFRPAPRATQIRDALAPLAQATPRDLLAIQLDDRALFLTPWHQSLMATLTPQMMAGKKSREDLRQAAEKWEGRAEVGAVSYRIVQAFRAAVKRRVFPAIFASCREAYPQFNWQDLPLEDALQALLRERPQHLLNPAFATWDDLLAAAIDDTATETIRTGRARPETTWGWQNRAQIKHPFSLAFPWLGRWLDLPADPLPGDNDMPRVQSPTHGASERFVVSPGREDEGIFHMPGGQSGHPLSPYYRAGHAAWVRGEPTPFLPGRPAHTLTLQPAAPAPR